MRKDLCVGGAYDCAKVMTSGVVHLPQRILYCDVIPLSLSLLIFKNGVTVLLRLTGIKWDCTLEALRTSGNIKCPMNGSYS